MFGFFVLAITLSSVDFGSYEVFDILVVEPQPQPNTPNFKP